MAHHGPTLHDMARALGFASLKDWRRARGGWAGNGLTQPYDVLYSDTGSIVMIEPQTDTARQFIADHVAIEDWQWLGPAFGVDHRMADDLLRGMEAHGLTVAAR